MSPLRSPSLRMRPRSPRALRMTAVLVAATLALSGCAMLQHPDATLPAGLPGQGGTPSAAASDGAAADDRPASDRDCTPTDAKVAFQPVVPGAQWTLLGVDVLTVRDGVLVRDRSTVSSSASLGPDANLARLDGDADAWLAVLVPLAVQEDVLDYGSADASFYAGLVNHDTRSDIQSSPDSWRGRTGHWVDATFSTLDTVSVDVGCRDGDIPLTLTVPNTDGLNQVAIECAVATASASTDPTLRIAASACPAS